jgi:hypothetical protein
MNGWTLALLIALVISIFAAAILLAISYPVKARRSRFRGRLPLEDELFYERYYASFGLPKTTVISLRHELASALSIDASKLLPTDRFSKELSVVRGWEYLDDAPDELFLLNRDRQKRLGVAIPLGDFQTADDYIRTIAKHESSKQS